MSGEGNQEGAFREVYDRERDAIGRLANLGRKTIGTGADDNIKLLETMYKKGVAKVVTSKRSAIRRDEVNELVREFVAFGAKAVLLPGSQRGGDFLNNQLRGQWAERVALSMEIDGLHLIPFGPSGAAGRPTGRPGFQ